MLLAQQSESFWRSDLCVCFILRFSPDLPGFKFFKAGYVQFFLDTGSDILGGMGGV
jgi:hypothetical protein